MRNTLLLFCFLFLISCTSESEKKAFVGSFELDGSSDIFLNIKSDFSFETNCHRFPCKSGTWEVSSFPTAMGIVITFHQSNGEFCEQLHWKESEMNEVLVSQEIEEEYIRSYRRSP